ncbi:hypothetical protein GGI43DRAFT_353070 [Trichoderma evansii]
MPSLKRDYPSSMYPEPGSTYGSSSYSNSGRSSKNGGDSHGARRNSDGHHSYNSDYRRGRDYHRGDRDRNERQSRDTYSTKRDSRRDDNRSYDRNSNNNHIDKKGRSSSLGFLERVLPREYRPSHADPEARLHRLQKEKENPGFDWTPGLVLGLIGAAALFNHERSLIRRQKKEYFD